MAESVIPALERLRSFRGRWADSDVIDQESGLTANDLDQVLLDLEGRYQRDETPDHEVPLILTADSDSPPPPRPLS